MNSDILKSMRTFSGNPRELKEALVEFISSLGISPTEQYVSVLKCLLTHHAHSTIEDICHTLRFTEPALTRSRVYTILEILTKVGAIQTIVVDRYMLYYDTDTSAHGHFVCSVCGEITDIDICKSMGESFTQGEIKRINIVCEGECNYCRSGVSRGKMQYPYTGVS